MARYWVVGQLPGAMQAVDDKFATNAMLRAVRLPVAASILAESGRFGVDLIVEEFLDGTQMTMRPITASSPSRRTAVHYRKKNRPRREWQRCSPPASVRRSWSRPAPRSASTAALAATARCACSI